MHRSYGLPGGGPWLILAECRSDNHNTLNAARGRSRGSDYKCTCPHARHLFAGRAEYDRQRSRLRPTESKNKYRAPLAYSITMPDMSRGACALPEYRAIFHDASLEPENGAPADERVRMHEARPKAKRICDERCPIRDECAVYVLTNERPRGSWGGVWGGMTPNDRRERRYAIA